MTRQRGIEKKNSFTACKNIHNIQQLSRPAIVIIIISYFIATTWMHDFPSNEMKWHDMVIFFELMLLLLLNSVQEKKEKRKSKFIWLSHPIFLVPLSFSLIPFIHFWLTLLIWRGNRFENNKRPECERERGKSLLQCACHISLFSIAWDGGGINLMLTIKTYSNTHSEWGANVPTGTILFFFFGCGQKHQIINWATVLCGTQTYIVHPDVVGRNRKKNLNFYDIKYQWYGMGWVKFVVKNKMIHCFLSIPLICNNCLSLLFPPSLTLFLLFRYITDWNDCSFIWLFFSIFLFSSPLLYIFGPFVCYCICGYFDRRLLKIDARCVI